MISKKQSESARKNKCNSKPFGSKPTSPTNLQKIQYQHKLGGFPKKKKKTKNKNTQVTKKFSILKL